MDLPIPVTKKAKLKSLSDGTEVEVHFNPASLVYSVENSNKQQSSDPTRRECVAQFSGKLTMDLQFDTTNTGEDVRKTTSKIANFMKSSGKGTNPSSGNAQAQPVVSFQWGTYEFRGTLESFKETIDFFSADGVPLRAMVSIGMAQQNEVFAETKNPPTANLNRILTGNNASATSLATMGGDPLAARQLGADNGLPSLRFTGGASIDVGTGIQLNAAAGFSASASAGVGLSGGVSFGAGAGLSAGGGVSLGAGGGASFKADAGVVAAASLQVSAGFGGSALFGGRASAGVPATAGALTGLEAGRVTVSSTARLNPQRMLPATVSTDVNTSSGASFSLGGAAKAETGFSADVGSSFHFSDRLIFDQ